MYMCIYIYIYIYDVCVYYPLNEVLFICIYHVLTQITILIIAKCFTFYLSFKLPSLNHQSILVYNDSAF
jgi:hypothetical protein